MTQREAGEGLREAGRRIMAEGIRHEDAQVLNQQIGALVGRSNPLGLNDQGLPPVGMLLHTHVAGILTRIGSMLVRNADQGNINDKATEVAISIIRRTGA